MTIYDYAYIPYTCINTFFCNTSVCYGYITPFGKTTKKLKKFIQNYK